MTGISIHSAFEELFGQKIEVIDTFVKEHKIDKEYFLRYSDKLLFEICKSGNLDLLIWVAETFNITTQDEMSQNHDGYCDNVWQEAFNIVCKYTDHLHIAKWIYKKFNRDEEDIYICDEHLLHVCMNGCIELFDWMRELVNIQIFDVLPRSLSHSLNAIGELPGCPPIVRLCCAHILNAACIGGNIEIIIWLLTVGFKYPRDHIHTYNHHVNNCENCRIETYGCSNYSLEKTFENTKTNSFYLAAIHGHLAALQLLYAEFDIPREIVTANNNEFIYDIIDNKNKNRAEVLKWLIMQFNLTIEDIMEFNYNYMKLNSFHIACKRGHLDVAQLIDEIACAARSPCVELHVNRAIAIACDSKEFYIFQWLVGRFDVTKETILSLRCDGETAFEAAAEMPPPTFGGGIYEKSWLITKIVMIDQIDMLNLIVEKFGVSRDELRRYNNQAFNVACARSNKSMVKYFCETIEMPMEDISANNFYSIRAAIDYNNWEVAEYIQNYFNITDVPAHILQNIIHSKCESYCSVDRLNFIMGLNSEWYANPMSHRIHFDTFKVACVKMNFIGAAWLKAKFNFTAEEIRTHGDELFWLIDTRAYNHTFGTDVEEDILWLLREFTAEDILRPIARISTRFSSVICELPLRAAPLPAAGAFVSINFLGKLITQSYDLTAIKVIEMFDLSEQDIHSNNHILLRVAIASKKSCICCYLLRRFYESDVILDVFNHLYSTDRKNIASHIAEHFEFAEVGLGHIFDVVDMIDRNRLGPKSALKLT